MILVINSGSSSLKFKLFAAKALKEKAAGIVERIGLKNSFLDGKAGKEKIKKDFSKGVENHQEALEIILNYLASQFSIFTSLKAIGHRVVHGGEEFVAPTKITDQALNRLKKYSQLAPLHNPPNLAGIEACRKLLSKVVNVAVFDTAYYKTIPNYAHLYAIPYKFYQQDGIRRYGFHGISHQYVAEEAARSLKRPLKRLKIITCHLGGGCSITATKCGKAIETSMGFTPLEGLIMGTRTGDIDAAIPLFLIRQLKMTPREVDELLNKKSGLLGVSGISNDMREILIAAGYTIPGYQAKNSKVKNIKYQKRASLALQMFIYRIQKYIGAYALILNGLDALVFTAGIGERNATIRGLILRGLKTLGKFKVLVIPTNEELMIAREVKKLYV